MSKKKKNCHGKGSAFERRVCNNLSLWVSDYTRKDIFWRAAMSGGRATVSMKHGVALASQAGDISAVDKLGHFLIDLFVIECKHYKDLGWLACFYGSNKSGIAQFWIKLCVESNEIGKLPMLIGKQNNKPDLVLLDIVGAGICINDKVKPLFIIPRFGMQGYLLRDLLLLPFEEIRKRNAGKKIRRRLYSDYG